VIGAIVDRNRLQRAAFARATALGVRAVRLPLAKHLTMDKTHVLTVNHCLELLTRVGHGEGWSEALQRTLPSRKGAEYDDGAAGDGEDGASATAQQAGGSGRGGKGGMGSMYGKESIGGSLLHRRDLAGPSKFAGWPRGAASSSKARATFSSVSKKPKFHRFPLILMLASNVISRRNLLTPRTWTYRWAR
jgi:hypothetical protein